jgi:hypothetical protein
MKIIWENRGGGIIGSTKRPNANELTGGKIDKRKELIISHLMTPVVRTSR